MRDTVFAFSTGPAAAAIAVLRLSGPSCRSVIRDMIDSFLEPRKATLSVVRDPFEGSAIDRCIVIWFPGPFSFTGEDCVEIHTHGSKAVKDRLLRCLEQMPGLKPAEAGDFTRIAFRNGKYDLAQVEGLGDLLEARTEKQRAQAFAQLSGSLSDVVSAWEETLLNNLALVEASIDFVDEDDVPKTIADGVRETIIPLIAEMSSSLEAGQKQEILKEGFKIAICGRPNVGKSSLLNWLAGRDVAIVTNEVGTTRDLIEIEIDWNGFLLVFTDGAGIRVSDEVAESIGIERSRSNAIQSNLVLWLFDDQSSASVDPILAGSGVEIVCVRTKSDLLEISEISEERGRCISTKNGSGLAELLDFVGGRVVEETGSVLSCNYLVHARQRAAIFNALEALQRVQDEEQLGTELLADELRIAWKSIASIRGVADVDQMLDRIFGRFCIGK